MQRLFIIWKLCFADWLADCLAALWNLRFEMRFTLADWLTGWLISWCADWLTGWLADHFESSFHDRIQYETYIAKDTYIEGGEGAGLGGCREPLCGHTGGVGQGHQWEHPDWGHMKPGSQSVSQSVSTSAVQSVSQPASLSCPNLSCQLACLTIALPRQNKTR